MPQNVTAAVLGEGEYVSRLVRSILEKEIIPARNLFIVSDNAAAQQAAEGYAASICKDDAAAVLKAEIILACAPRKAMPTLLASIAQITGQKVLVTICEDSRVDLEYVKERVVNGTEIITATLHKRDDGGLSAEYAIARGVRLYLHQPCRDLVNALCEG